MGFPCFCNRQLARWCFWFSCLFCSDVYSGAHECNETKLTSFDVFKYYDLLMKIKGTKFRQLLKWLGYAIRHVYRYHHRSVYAKSEGKIDQSNNLSIELSHVRGDEDVLIWSIEMKKREEIWVWLLVFFFLILYLLHNINTRGEGCVIKRYET